MTITITVPLQFIEPNMNEVMYQDIQEETLIPIAMKLNSKTWKSKGNVPRGMDQNQCCQKLIISYLRNLKVVISNFCNKVQMSLTRLFKTKVFTDLDFGHYFND